VLRRRLGVSCECFASPLNATLPDYFSAFPDVDSFFGSRGSFFGANPIEGSFEVNPPYVPEVLLAAVHHAKRLLATAEAAARALSFVFVVPTWTPCAFHKELTSR
jgi:phosphorylated CTD-interacting factor 1|tara:strand:- start:532 stop:846 length:315 start_codon:yes stop_codon:yes gene_type:complete